MSKSKIVDLQKCEDGTYDTKPSTTKAITKATPHKKEEKYNKHHVRTEADEFLGGLDAGLDFVEAIKSRALRILSLRD